MRSHFSLLAYLYRGATVLSVVSNLVKVIQYTVLFPLYVSTQQ